MKHNVCNNIQEVTPSKVLTGRRCPFCYGNQTKEQKTWEQELKELGNNEYVSLEPYVNNRTKILIKHTICNHEWKISPSNFIKGHRCPKCSTERTAKSLSLSHEEFLKKLQLLNEPEYILIDKYIKNSKKVKFKHLKCNNVFSTLPNNFIKGNRCPYCKVGSKGEEKIKQWLTNNNINYIKEYHFDDLRGEKNKPLRFDFAIMNQENNVELLIEFDGRQHFVYEESSMFSKKDFEKLQSHDKQKNQYCINNNILLIRINYKDYNNIENILRSIILEKDSETIRKLAINS